MDGYGYNSQLPDSLKKRIPNSMIFNGKRDNEGSRNGGIGIWSPGEPGHGNMFQTDGVSNSLSKMFGPELSFAKKMTNDGIKIAIDKYKNSRIKFANGGDRDNKTTPESIFCNNNNVELLWGIGGNNKSNSSSWILKKWKENN